MREHVKRAVRLSISVVAAGLIMSWLIALGINLMILRDVGLAGATFTEVLLGALALVVLASLYGLGVGVLSLVVLLIPLLLLTAWAEHRDFTSWGQITGAASGLGFLLGACGVHLWISANSFAAWCVVAIFAFGGGIAGDLYFRQRRRAGSRSAGPSQDAARFQSHD